MSEFMGLIKGNYEAKKEVSYILLLPHAASPSLFISHSVQIDLPYVDPL